MGFCLKPSTTTDKRHQSLGRLTLDAKGMPETSSHTVAVHPLSQLPLLSRAEILASGGTSFPHLLETHYIYLQWRLESKSAVTQGSLSAGCGRSHRAFSAWLGTPSSSPRETGVLQIAQRPNLTLAWIGTPPTMLRCARPPRRLLGMRKALLAEESSGNEEASGHFARSWDVP
eukprot:scaffold1402_cov254-Pinguiococcus_pyrenoidosus.AAC.4